LIHIILNLYGEKMEKDDSLKLSRRKFCKVIGLAGFAAQAVTLPSMAYLHGKDYDTYAGWESFEGQSQYFDRKPFELKGGVKELYEKFLPIEGKVVRPNQMIELSMMRMKMVGGLLKKNPNWKYEDGPAALGVPKPIVDYYKKWKTKGFDHFKTDYEHITITPKINKEIHSKYDDHTAISNAYFNAWGHSAHFPHEITDPPEISDFQVHDHGKTYDLRDINKKRKKRGALLKFKSPDLAAELVKKTAYQFGATLVGIAKFNPDYVYKHIRGISKSPKAGKPNLMAQDPVPKHWKYVIVIGIPHEWDQLVSNPQYGDSYDAYMRLRACGVRVAEFLKGLGYPARWHVPPFSYDLVAPPYAIEAGLGQFGRMGTVVTPETGGNIRLACVTTDLEMTIDKPIDFGVTDFCEKCKICADQCPSNSISYADKPDQVVRGIRHWEVDKAGCFKFWEETMGPIGCRLCIAACPYSRKGNWVHGMARAIDPLDKTGVTSSGLLWMQKTFWKAPEKEEYLHAPNGRHASYRPAPTWLNTEHYFDINVPHPKDIGK
jgi:epoxyqueuosine reductase